MDIALLWFTCKNPQCDQIPIKGYARTFLARLEGSYIHKDNDLYFKHAKFGEICIISDYDTPNSFIHTIRNAYYCRPCWQRIQNEKLLFPNGVNQ